MMGRRLRWSTHDEVFWIKFSIGPKFEVTQVTLITSWKKWSGLKKMTFQSCCQVTKTHLNSFLTSGLNIRSLRLTSHLPTKTFWSQTPVSLTRPTVESKVQFYKKRSESSLPIPFFVQQYSLEILPIVWSMNGSFRSRIRSRRRIATRMLPKEPNGAVNSSSCSHA